MRERKGFSLIEATIAVGVFGITIVTLGNFLAATDRLTTAAERREAGLGYAREALEASVVAVPNAYHCTAPSGSSCTRDGQTCPLQAGRTTCWLPASSGPFHLVLDGSNQWMLTAGEEPIPGGTFTRVVTVADVPRGAGEPSWADGQRKLVTASVNWYERGQTHSVSLDTQLTAWKD